jgi:voltage-gated potassium channel
MTVLFLSTTGARDVDNLNDFGMIWGIIVITVGAGAAAYAFSNLLALITGGELRKVLGRRNLEVKIRNMKNHFIICGYGRIGALISEELHAKGIPFVIIDSDPTKTEIIEKKGYIYLYGDATEEETIVRAGVKDAKGLVTVIRNDADNVYVTLLARGLNADLQIVALSESKKAEDKLIRAGANRVVSPDLIGAMRITSLLVRPAIVEFADIAAKGVELEVNEINLSDESSLIGKSLKDSHLRDQVGLIVVAIKRSDGTAVFAPTADQIFQQGDSLITVGKSGSLNDVKL